MWDTPALGGGGRWGAGRVGDWVQWVPARRGGGAWDLQCVCMHVCIAGALSQASQFKHVQTGPGPSIRGLCVLPPYKLPQASLGLEAWDCCFSFIDIRFALRNLQTCSSSTLQAGLERHLSFPQSVLERTSALGGFLPGPRALVGSTRALVGSTTLLPVAANPTSSPLRLLYFACFGVTCSGCSLENSGCPRPQKFC